MSHAAPTSKHAALPETADRPEEEPSIGELVASASRDVSSLIRNEIALVKSEVKISVKAGGIGAALFAAAAFVLLLGVIMASIALAYFIHMTGLDLAWSFSIVFVLYVLLAGLLAFVGYKKIRAVRPPEKAIHQAQETKNALTNRS